MRSTTSKWFECQVVLDKLQENGTNKRVNELYTVDAMSFAEAEARITDEMAAYIQGEFEIKNINPAPYKEVMFSDKNTDDCWFRIKLQFISYDERTQKEKRTTTTYLLQADKAETANQYINEVMSKTMMEYRVVGNVETKIMDVYEHK